MLGVAASAGVIALDTFGRHPTGQAERAARNLYRDRFAARFWLGGVMLGLAAPAALGVVFLAAGGVGRAGSGGRVRAGWSVVLRGRLGPRRPERALELMGDGVKRTSAGRPSGYGYTDAVARDFPEADADGRVVEYDPAAWPRKVTRESMLVPTVCFNCESGCGLLAYVDTETFEVRKLEGHPGHPGSRGRNCAKGPATLNQITDPERILYPLRRTGPRGGGEWERVSWDHVLDTFAERMNEAFAAGRNNDVCYFVGALGRTGSRTAFSRRGGATGSRN